jgi:GalNAc-alpha-(1->4)-GalNAc-alpha-(1->3)-diNAcBac-PP-undecaprenol alpha-1,4-N-acetyl-D-galactosaminyltransferase
MPSQPGIPQKILFLVSSMHGGGAERIAAHLCNYWAMKGHQVALMPTFSGKGECAYHLDKRIHLHYLADRVGSSEKTLGTALRRFMELRRYLKDAKPNVVISFLTNVNIAALLASRGYNLRVIVSERSYPPHDPISWPWALLRRITYHWATRVVAQTNSAAAWIRSNCPGSQVVTIPNPVVIPIPIADPIIDPRSFGVLSRKTLLAVGSLVENKGFDKLIAAFSRIAAGMPDWDLIILGEGPFRETLETQRNALGLEQRVHIPGRAGNVADWYECAQLLALTSRVEGFPNVLLEAMAYGVPVVSFDCDAGPRDIIHHGQDGLLVPPDSGAEGLARALQSLVDNKNHRQAMGRAARGVRERYSMEQIAAQWAAIMMS